MKRKFLDFLFRLMFICGIMLFIGAVGEMDYMVEVGKEYPLFTTVKLIGISAALSLPAIIRGLI